MKQNGMHYKVIVSMEGNQLDSSMKSLSSKAEKGFLDGRRTFHLSLSSFSSIASFSN
jgi:hypothetical protein